MLQEKKTIFHAKSALRELSGDPGLYDEVSASQIFFLRQEKAFLSPGRVLRDKFLRGQPERPPRSVPFLLCRYRQGQRVPANPPLCHGLPGGRGLYLREIPRLACAGRSESEDRMK